MLAQESFSQSAATTGMTASGATVERGAPAVLLEVVSAGCGLAAMAALCVRARAGACCRAAFVELELVEDAAVPLRDFARGGSGSPEEMEVSEWCPWWW